MIRSYLTVTKDLAKNNQKIEINKWNQNNILFFLVKLTPYWLSTRQEYSPFHPLGRIPEQVDHPSPKATQHLQWLDNHHRVLPDLALCRVLACPGQDPTNHPLRSDPMCKLCQAPTESTAHALTSCRATADVRDRMLPELLNIVAWVQPCCSILESYEQPWVLTQFILDCTSLNLPDSSKVWA